MRTIVLLAALLLAGCANLTERQNQWLKVGASVLVIGAIAAHQENDSMIATAAATCQPNAFNCRPVK